MVICATHPRLADTLDGTICPRKVVSNFIQGYPLEGQGRKTKSGLPIMFHLVEGAGAELQKTGRKTAIVSIIIGDVFVNTWLRLCKFSWAAYAEKFDMDVVLIKGYLDNSSFAVSRSPAWQKLLILEQPWSINYENIIWMDCDIIISTSAPNILDFVPNPSLIGICTQHDRLSASQRQIMLERMYGMQITRDGNDLQQYLDDSQFIKYGCGEHGGVMYNTGVIVLSPTHHSDVLRQCYSMPEKGRLYEQPALSREISMRGLAHLLSARFNWGVFESLLLYFPVDIRKSYSGNLSINLVAYLVRRELANAYFLHFYGCMEWLRLLSFDHVFGEEKIVFDV
jgi:hypothetical protein